MGWQTPETTKVSSHVNWRGNSDTYSHRLTDLTVCSMTPALQSYDHVIVALSGGKDSVAALLTIIESGIPPERIELWHHDVDGGSGGFMDWPSTAPYIRAIARELSLPCYFSWRNGGIRQEMLRDGMATAPVSFETPVGVVTKGGHGPIGTRLRFPQISANLAVRWCSASAKIDVASVALRGQERFFGKRTLFITGERAEESPGRARYPVFERHRTDLRHSLRKPRLVDHWRPVHQWTETQVWACLKKHALTPALPYRIGFSRLSCQFCIFMSADQASTLRFISPARFDMFARYEAQFGCTIKRAMTLHSLADLGSPFIAALEQPDLVSRALLSEWYGPIRDSNWVLPAGAFREGGGPL